MAGKPSARRTGVVDSFALGKMYLREELSTEGSDGLNGAGLGDGAGSDGSDPDKISRLTLLTGPQNLNDEQHM